MKVKTDLHLHSCVSPKCESFLSPKVITSKLKEEGVGLAALTDVNTSANLPAFSLLCEEAGIHPLFGIEAQTAEEIRILALFNDLNFTYELGRAWYMKLPNIINIPEENGFQYYVNEEGSVMGKLNKYLGASAKISLKDLIETTEKHQGILIPASVDIFSFFEKIKRTPFYDYPWDALDVSSPKQAKKLISEYNKTIPVIYSQSIRYENEIAGENFIIDTGNLPIEDSQGKTNMEAVRFGLKNSFHNI